MSLYPFQEEILGFPQGGQAWKTIPFQHFPTLWVSMRIIYVEQVPDVFLRVYFLYQEFHKLLFHFVARGFAPRSYVTDTLAVPADKKRFSYLNFTQVGLFSPLVMKHPGTSGWEISPTWRKKEVTNIPDLLSHLSRRVYVVEDEGESFNYQLDCYLIKINFL